MKAKKLGYILLATLLAMIMVIPGNLALADPPPETVDVLVNFFQPPGPEESQLIESLGGTVKKVYHIVPTIAATMPSDKLNQLEADPRVKSVEADTRLSVAFAGEVLPWGVDRIDAELVHPTNKGTGVKIAVLDSGIDLDHPDLVVAGNVTFVSGTTNGDDDNGHGTLVAGIIGALDNDIGVIGVAPETALYSVKVLDQGGSGLMSSILSGIEWARDNNMQVINMSFGGAMQMPSTIADALNTAYNAGIVNIAGAGNGGNASGQGNNVWYPARYESVIAVGATDNQDARYTTSSTGYTLEVVAPGVNIDSTAMGGGYGVITGTSASAAHAAGVAALLIASGLTSNNDIRHRLRNSAEDLGAAGWDSQFGKGLINANQAITFSEPPDQRAPTTTISLSGTPTSWGWWNTNVEVTLTAQDNPGGSGIAVTKYSLDGGGTWLTYSSPLTITSEGITLVLARSWDNAGNDEGPPAFKEVKIDKTPPLATTFYLFGTMGNNDWYVSNVGIDFVGSDNPGGSGIGLIQYSLNGGGTWQTYTTQITITTEGTNTVLVRASDKAGNQESPPGSRTFKIDKTPPALTETVVPAEIARQRKGVMVNVSYNGTAADPVSGLSGLPNTILIDEYGVYSQNFGSSLSGTVSVEAWSNGNDSNGRTYTFRITATDMAGNQGYVDGIALVPHP